MALNLRWTLTAAWRSFDSVLLLSWKFPSLSQTSDIPSPDALSGDHLVSFFPEKLKADCSRGLSASHLPSPRPTSHVPQLEPRPLPPLWWPLWLSDACTPPPAPSVGSCVISAPLLMGHSRRDSWLSFPSPDEDVLHLSCSPCRPLPDLSVSPAARPLQGTFSLPPPFPSNPTSVRPSAPGLQLNVGDSPV